MGTGPETRFVGVTDDSIVFLTLNEHEDRDDPYFSITGTEISRLAETLEQIQRREHDSVMDGDYDYLLRENEDDERSLGEFREDLARDLEYNAGESGYWYGPDALYHRWLSTDQIDIHMKARDIIEPAGQATRADLDFIWKSWKKYQLKNLSKVPDSVRVRLREIFAKFPEEPTLDDIRG